VIPALAYPAAILTSDKPVAVAEKTINKRVSGVTDMDKPVRIPLLTVPIPSIPVSAGAKVTGVPIGEKILSGVVELYNCAVMVIVDSTRARATVVLKYAAMDVIVPARGTEKAKLSN
jgi:hypothetical protein